MATNSPQYMRDYRLAHPEYGKSLRERAAKRLRDQRYREKHPGKHNAIVGRWRKAHPEKEEQYYEKRKVRKLASHRLWSENNRLRVRDLRRAYLTRKAKAPGSHSYEQWMARVNFYGWRCAYCLNGLTAKTLTQDHVIPLVAGGSDWASNLVPACKRCNCKKNKKFILPSNLRKAA